jgi:hypothetical protein
MHAAEEVSKGPNHLLSGLTLRHTPNQSRMKKLNMAVSRPELDQVRKVRLVETPSRIRPMNASRLGWLLLLSLMPVTIHATIRRVRKAKRSEMKFAAAGGAMPRVLHTPSSKTIQRKLV